MAECHQHHLCETCTPDPGEKWGSRPWGGRAFSLSSFWTFLSLWRSEPKNQGHSKEKQQKKLQIKRAFRPLSSSRCSAFTRPPGGLNGAQHLGLLLQRQHAEPRRGTACAGVDGLHSSVPFRLPPCFGVEGLGPGVLLGLTTTGCLGDS